MLKGSTRRVKKGTENELQVLPPHTKGRSYGVGSPYKYDQACEV